MQKKPLYICLLIILAGLMCWLIRPQSELALLSGGFLVFCGGLSLAVYLPKWRKNAGDMAVPLSLRYLLDTSCLLNWDELSKNIDDQTSRLLKPMLNQGRLDGRSLRPGLVKAAAGLKKICRGFPHDAGAAAYLGFCLILLSRINGREAAYKNWREIPEKKLWLKGSICYRRALALAPEAASLAADWGRVLESRGFLLLTQGQEPLNHFNEAQGYYGQAVEIDPELRAAWRGQGRILAFQVMELGAEPALDKLERAVELYEQARGGGRWGWDFYEEFGRVAFALGQYHPSRAVHYFRYAARLFTLADEMNGDQPESRTLAGRALHQAAFSVQDHDPDQAEELYRESLTHFRAAIRRNAADADSLAWAARSLTALYSLSAGRLNSSAWLDEAAELCARAAAIDPDEDILSDWARVLSLKAEQNDGRSGELWAATARKYALAVARGGAEDETAAVNWHNWAYALSSLAESRATDGSRLKLLGQAAIKYEKAASLNGDNLITLENWGVLLGDMAELVDEPKEVERLSSEASEKFERAARLYPGQAGSWRRWSAHLQDRARAERNPARRRELWQAALDKLENGVQADPEEAATWVMWGQTLSELYWEGAEYEKPLLISAIIEKYEKALDLEADDQAGVWTLLGRARLEASTLTSDISVCGSELENAAAAADCFEKACVLAPGQAARWSDWGRAFFRLAQLLDNDASALAALEGAGEKYETAMALEPENGEHHTGLSHILYQWAWHLDDQEGRILKFRQAYAHCAEAGRLAPYDPLVWRNWGKVTEALAGLENDPLKSFDWQSEAEEKFYRADIIDATLSRDRRH